VAWINRRPIKMMSILSGVLTGEKVAGARAVGVSIADRIHWTEPPLDLAGQLLLWVLNRIFNVKVS
jgi:hypothetical protein